MKVLVVDLWPGVGAPGHCLALQELLEACFGWTTGIIHGYGLSTQKFTQILEERRPSLLILVGSPIRFGTTAEERNNLSRQLNSTQIVYWEGDAWGRGKPLTSSLRFWLGMADHVFHTGGIPRVRSHVGTGSYVHFAPNAYCHVQFASAEREGPPPVSSNAVVMIGNNVTRSRIPIPGLTGIPGGLPRWRLARKAERRFRDSGFHLYGHNWPSSMSSGSLPFNKQINMIRSGSLSINWDHFAHYPNYSSDRLTISLLAGRPHITTDHPPNCWFPELDGLKLASSITGILKYADEVRYSSPLDRFQWGQKLWEWTRHRMSTRSLAVFMLSRIFAEISPPRLEPWCHLPAPQPGTLSKNGSRRTNKLV